MSKKTLSPEERGMLLGSTIDLVSEFPHLVTTEGDLQDLLTMVYGHLEALVNPGEPAGFPNVALVPAVPIKKSVHPDYLICLDDGIKVKMLKRHLRGLGMTPDQYRAKWDLPSDYPMVCPNYTLERSRIAKETGLGQKKAA